MNKPQNIDNVFKCTGFLNFNERCNLPKHPGIYFLTNRSKEVVYYVGSTQNIYRRCNSTHHVFLKINHPEFMLIGFISDDKTAKELSVIEKNIIQKYKPKYNESLKSKTTVFSFRINEEDLKELLEYAKSLNVSPSELMKNAVKEILNKPNKMIGNRNCFLTS